MLHRLSALVAMLVAASAFLSAQRTAPSVADVIYVHGKVVTVDARSQVAGAFAVKGDRFLAVGTDAEIRALAGRGTRTVDLHGRTVVPGLIDNHNHQYHVALLALRGVDMKDVPSLAEMLARLRRAAAAARPGETIFTTTGWTPDALPEKRGPTRQELDAIASDRPIVVYASRSRVHGNTAALKALGLSRERPVVDGVTAGTDTTGEPDGVLTGSPGAFMKVMARVVPPPSLDENKSIIAKIQAQQHAMGLTGIRDLQLHPDVMRAYYELWRDHALTLRTSI
jgi:predicted amidohydrolase YtcJ